MALSFSVFNKFKAVDGVSKPVGKMRRSVSKFGNTAKRDFAKADKSAGKFGRTLAGVAGGLGIFSVGSAISRGVGSLAAEFVSFDDAITAAGVRFTDIGPNAENFVGQLESIKKSARLAGATTEFTAAQAAQALDFLAKAGWSSAESIKGLNSMINLATASGEDFATVADMSSDLLGAFGLNADNTAKKIKNLNRLNDVLAITTVSANVTIEDMFETMKQVGPVATGVLGASLEEVSALTGVLGNSGIKGSEAMTALKNVYLRLASPVSEARKTLDRFNISLSDGHGGVRKVTDVMEELGKKVSGLSKIEQAEIFDTLFGKRAIAGAKNLMDNIKNIKKLEKAALNAGGATKKMAEIIRKSLGNRLKSLQSALIEFGFKIVNTFSVKGKDAITDFTNAVRKMDPKPFVGFITGAIKAIGVISDFIPAIKELVKMYAVWRVAIIAINTVIAIQNGLFAVNPISLFIAAIVGLGFALKFVLQNWKILEAWFDSGITAINDKFVALGESIASIFSGLGEKISNFGLGIGDKILDVLGFETQPVNIRAPISPNAGMIANSKSEINNRSTVDVNFNNLPGGTNVKQSGNMTGFNLNTGMSAPLGAS